MVWSYVIEHGADAAQRMGACWRLICGDAPTGIYCPSMEAADIMAKLLSYESGAAYSCVPATEPEYSRYCLAFTRLENFQQPQIMARTYPFPEMATGGSDNIAGQMEEMAKSHVRRLNHASETPEDVRAAWQPPVAEPADPEDRAAAEAATKIFETADNEAKDGKLAKASGIAQGNHAGEIVVSQCGDCGEAHTVELFAYSRQHPPFTHYFFCPKTQDPVGLTVLKNPAGQLVELHNKVLRNLMIAQATGAFMVAIWRYEAEGDQMKVRCAYVTHNFPRSEFKTGTELLSKMLKEEQGPMQAGPLVPGNPSARPTLGRFFDAAVAGEMPKQEPQRCPSGVAGEPPEDESSGVPSDAPPGYFPD